MADVKLKPCPFCGKRPSILAEADKESGNGHVRVRCVNRECWVHVTTGTYLYEIGARTGIRKRTIADAVHDWNTRKEARRG